MSDEIQRCLYYSNLMGYWNRDLYKRLQQGAQQNGWDIAALSVKGKPDVFLLYKKVPTRELASTIAEIGARLEVVVGMRRAPREVFVFTHPIYILEDIMYRLHGVARELLQTIYFNITNDFVTPLTAYSTIAHEIIHLLLVGESEADVRKLEQELYEKFMKGGSALLQELQDLLQTYRKEADDFALQVTNMLEVSFVRSNTSFAEARESASEVQDIIIYKK